MKTTSILSKKTNSASCTTINMISSKTISRSNPSGEKATIINMFPNQVINKNSDVKFSYTLKQGDEKRLNQKGVLTVYNMNEPINIPVEKLLGKWKNTHVGVTLIASNEKWLVKDGIENVITKHEPLLQTAFLRLLKFVVA